MRNGRGYGRRGRFPRYSLPRVRKPLGRAAPCTSLKKLDFTLFCWRSVIKKKLHVRGAHRDTKKKKNTKTKKKLKTANERRVIKSLGPVALRG